MNKSVWALLIPARRDGTAPPASAILSTRTTLEGDYRFAGVKPGEYMLIGWEEHRGETNPFFNPGFLKSHIGLGALVNVTAGAKIKASAPVVMP